MAWRLYYKTLILDCMDKRILSQEEILCMQYAGMSASRMMNLQFEAEEYEEAVEAYGDKAERVMAMQRECGVVTLTYWDEGFPPPLRKIGGDCPPMIHCLGDLPLLNPTDGRIAIIGARAASPAGNRKAYELGRKFAEEGGIVVSGLALGCDTSAHEGCLDVGGRTIAIVATGLNRVHPKENAPLQQRILDHGGLVISEQPFGVKANPARLVARSRLQAALSKTVVLAECPMRSGSMYTMRFARRYHKSCFAASYPKYSDVNAGNELLLRLNLAQAI